MLVKNKNIKYNTHIFDFDYPIFGAILFICSFSLIIIFFIYENVKISSSLKNVRTNRVWNYLEKKTAANRTSLTPFAAADGRQTKKVLEIDQTPVIYEVELSYRLSGVKIFLNCS